MLLSLLNFIWIFITAFLFGFAACRILIRYHLMSEQSMYVDTILVSGLAVLTAFAQWFSLFYRVGILATLFLFAADIFLLFVFRKKLLAFWQGLTAVCNIYKYLLWITIFAIFFSVAASTPPTVYDTSLYHNQAIQWIEKFGVVKGLGNLHNRLAYNSSFFAL